MKKLLYASLLLIFALALTACGEEEVVHEGPYALTGIWDDDDTNFASWYFGVRIHRPDHWMRPPASLYAGMTAFSDIFFMYDGTRATAAIFDSIAGEGVEFVHLREGWILCRDREADLQLELLRLPDDNPHMTPLEFMAARIQHMLGDPWVWAMTHTPWSETETRRIGHLDWYVAGVRTTDDAFPHLQFFANLGPDGFVRWITIGYFEEYRLEEALSLITAY